MPIIIRPAFKVCPHSGIINQIKKELIGLYWFRRRTTAPKPITVFICLNCFMLRVEAKHNISEINQSIMLHCIVAYGVSILTVTENLIESVRYKVEQFTGIKIDRIDVIVEGIRVID